jgi:hypothetical protein
MPLRGTPAGADSFLQNVYDILKPEGVFYLDTPNRHVTKIQLPDRYTNSDHKIERVYPCVCVLYPRHI